MGLDNAVTLAGWMHRLWWELPGHSNYFAGLANAVFSWQDSKLFAILKTDDWFGGKTRLREELRRQLS